MPVQLHTGTLSHFLTVCKTILKQGGLLVPPHSCCPLLSLERQKKRPGCKDAGIVVPFVSGRSQSYYIQQAKIQLLNEHRFIVGRKHQIPHMMHNALHPGAIICSTGDEMEILIEIVVLWEEVCQEDWQSLIWFYCKGFQAEIRT